MTSSKYYYCLESNQLYLEFRGSREYTLLIRELLNWIRKRSKISPMEELRNGDPLRKNTCKIRKRGTRRTLGSSIETRSMDSKEPVMRWGRSLLIDGLLCHPRNLSFLLVNNGQVKILSKEVIWLDFYLSKIIWRGNEIRWTK